jgi:hypothetical protein
VPEVIEMEMQAREEEKTRGNGREKRRLDVSTYQWYDRYKALVSTALAVHSQQVSAHCPISQRTTGVLRKSQISVRAKAPSSQTKPWAVEDLFQSFSSNVTADRSRSNAYEHRK